MVNMVLCSPLLLHLPLPAVTVRESPVILQAVFLRAEDGGAPRAGEEEGPAEEAGTVQRAEWSGCTMPSCSSRSFRPYGGSGRT